MDADWWNAVAVIGAILVPIVGGIFGLSRTRIRARGDQAETSLRLLRELDDLASGSTLTSGESQALEATRTNLRYASRYAAAEYARLQLRDGWSATAIWFSVAYGVLLVAMAVNYLVSAGVRRTVVDMLVAGTFLIPGMALLIAGVVAWILKVRRRGNMRRAGLPAPTFLTMLTGNIQFFRVQLRRLAQKAELKRYSDPGPTP